MIFLLKLLGFGSLLFCLHWGSLAPAQEAKSPSDNQKQKDGQTANTQDSKPTDEVELKGIFEAAKSSPIMLAPKEWATLTLDEAVAHGTTVDKGDVLLSLDTDKLDEAIDDAKGELQTETLALENAEIQFNLLRRTSAMSLADVIAAEKLASEDLKEFITTGRDRRVTSAERSVESARNSLAYQTEELRQLKKMYQADDLTEDTEEIILKRTRDAVDRAEYFLDTATDSKRRSLAYTIPRSEEELKTALKRATLALDEAQRTTPNSLKQKKLALDKQRQALDKQRKKIARLRTDRKMLKIRSPRAGVIYFGSSKRGKWTDSENDLGDAAAWKCGQSEIHFNDGRGTRTTHRARNGSRKFAEICATWRGCGNPTDCVPRSKTSRKSSACFANSNFGRNF